MIEIITRLVYNKISIVQHMLLRIFNLKEIEVIINFLINNVTVDTSDVKSRDKKDYLIKMRNL
ncbi:MAG: hypothetical protein ACLSBH_22525 [Coprobacillus cateniformis]